MFPYIVPAAAGAGVCAPAAGPAAGGDGRPAEAGGQQPESPSTHSLLVSRAEPLTAEERKRCAGEPPKGCGPHGVW